MADEFGDPQHALRRLAAVMMGSGHGVSCSETRASRPRFQMIMVSQKQRSLLKRALDLLDAVALDDVAGAHILIVLERHAAFLPSLDLANLVLEALQRRQLALVHDDIVADESHVGAALDSAV